MSATEESIKRDGQGRRIALARDAFFASDEARMLSSELSGPAAGKYLRNRLEVAFIAGYIAAVQEATL